MFNGLRLGRKPDGGPPAASPTDVGHRERPVGLLVPRTSIGLGTRLVFSLQHLLVADVCRKRLPGPTDRVHGPGEPT